MPKQAGKTHTSPRERREIVARVIELAKDYSLMDTYQMVADEKGVCKATVGIWHRRLKNQVTVPLTHSVQVENLASSDFEIAEPEYMGQRTTLIPVKGRMVELIASDIHYPYEDPVAYQLFLDVAYDMQPDVLVLLGDIMDCYAVSAHDKDANRSTPAAFKEELVYARTKLGELRDMLPNTRIIYKEGNHETRLSRYILKNAAVLSNLKAITLPEMLSLKELNIEWVGNNDRLRIGKLWHIHGNEIAGGGQSPARLKYQRMQCNVIFGHLHTRDKYRPHAYDGQQHGAWANPCLCRLDAEYLHHAHTWSTGFTPVYHDPDGFQVEETEVIKTGEREAKAIVAGKTFEVAL